MKHGVKQDLFFLLQYPVIMILWYWLFRDDPVARFAGGTVVAVYSLLILVRPRWFPNRPGVFGRHFPGGVHAGFRMMTSFMGILLGVFMLAGYRITTVRTLGIITLILVVANLSIYLRWIKGSDDKERAENRWFWAFAISVLLVFCALSIWFITMGDREATLFSQTSPYPMMIFFALMGIWHYAVVKKKERLDMEHAPPSA